MNKMKLISSICIIFLISSSAFAEKDFPSQLPKEKRATQKTKQIKTKRGGDYNSRILKKVIDQNRIQKAEKTEWTFEEEVATGYGIGIFTGLMAQKGEESGLSSRGSFGIMGEGRFSRLYSWNALLGSSTFPVFDTGSYGFELGVSYQIFQLELIRVFQENGKNLFGPRFTVFFPLGSRDLTTGVSYKFEAGVGALDVRNPSVNQNSLLLPLHIGAEGEFGTLIVGLNWRLGVRLFHLPSASDFPEWGGHVRVTLFKPL
jgi:hypothetical protein